jgi:acetate---CoA ligase (ADP-forming)
MDFEISKRQVAALTAPRNVALVGASDRRGSWSARVWRNLNRYAFPGPIYLINPGRKTIWDQPCYPDLASLPEAPDHMVVLVPGARVPELLREGARAGARSATIFSTGFGEAGDQEGTDNAQRLAAAIEETGLGVSGPNCLGNVSAKGRLVTLVEDRQLAVRPGPIALVGQSGGVMIFINQALEERGLFAQYMITSGNEIGLSLADYVAFFASEADVRVIIIYIDAVAHLEQLKAACRLARDAGKSIIAIKLGQTPAGREAAMAHTGLLAGSMHAFDAVMGELGLIRAETIDDAVELAELLVHTGAAPGRRLGAVTLSGAFRGLLLDAAVDSGLEFPPLAPATIRTLNPILSVGSLLGNPIDGGFGVISSADAYMACIEALDADPNIDTILLQEALPREPGSHRSETYIAMVEAYAAEKAAKPIAFVTMASHGQTDFSRDLRARAPHVSFLQEAKKTMRAIQRMATRAESEVLARMVPAPTADIPPVARAILDQARARSNSEANSALNEAQSKEFLRAYGIVTPREALVASSNTAVAAADRLGYPIVLKLVSARLLHKSDIGAVKLDIRDPKELRTAYDGIMASAKAHGLSADVQGILVCNHIRGGLELALGLHRDPEMGPVVMVSSGGVLLELIQDAEFRAPPITPVKAMDMISRTKSARLLQGYRGQCPFDETALSDALVALGRIATDFNDAIVSIDINPFVALPKGQGGLALDALVVLKAGSIAAPKPSMGHP